MFYTYLLKSRKDESLYVGFAPDLKARFQKHMEGLVRSTKNLRPLVLVYYEAYRSKHDALMREKQLKRFAKSYSMLKRRIKDSLMLQG